MSVLDRKLFREIVQTRVMLVAIVGITAIGIASLVAMLNSHKNLVAARDSYYATCRMPDFWVDIKKLPRSELTRIARIPGVSELRPRIASEANVQLDDVERPLSGVVLSLPADPKPVLANIVMTKGGYFSRDGVGEVIVHAAFADAHGLKPGDRIQLILNNRLQTLLIVGTAVSSEFVYQIAPGGLVPEPESYGVFFVSDKFAEDTFDMQGACNQIVGLLSPELRTHPDHILDEIERQLDDYGVLSTTPRREQVSHWFLNSEIQGLKVTSTILPAMFLAVAAVILNTLMSRIAEMQRSVVGTLKAIGYSNGAMFIHFMRFGLLVGGIGGLVGIAGGLALAGLMTHEYRIVFTFPQFENRPYPPVMAAGMLMSVAFAVLGSLRGVSQIVRLQPAEAMRPKPPEFGRRNPLEYWPAIWMRLGAGWRMVVRNLTRQRLRTLAGLFSSAIGCSLIFVAFQTRDSMSEMIRFQYDQILLSDFELTFKDDRELTALADVARLPGVDRVEPVFSVACTFRNDHQSKEGGITGLIPSARLTVPRNLKGDAVEVPQSGVLLTRALANELNVSAGETIVVEPTRGDKTPCRILVAQVVDSYLGMAAYANFGYLNALVGEESAVSAVQLKLDPRTKQTQAFYREVKRLAGIQTVTSVRSQKAKLDELILDKMLISLFMVTTFSGLILFGSILNSSLISLSERRVEIATMRVLGYTPQEVGSVFLREGLTLNLAGSLLGLPLGYGISQAMIGAYDTELFRLPWDVANRTWCLPILAAIAFTWLAHLPVMRAIRRLDWQQALNVKE